MADDIPVNASKTMPYSPSLDGKWVCYVEKTNTATGRLILESVSTENKIELCDNIICDFEDVPIKWAPDSSCLLYEKNGNIYFCTPDAMNRGVEVEESYRKIGRGTINSVAWASEKSFVYIDDYLVYKINSKELYTLGLYSGIIGNGTAIGRLPFQFNSSRDEFSVNSDATGIVLAQEKKNLTYFRTQMSSADYMDIVYSKPYTDSKASLADYEIFWNRNGLPILWQLKLPFTSTTVRGTAALLDNTSKTVLEVTNSGKPVISPNKSYVAFFSGSTIYVYDINTWNCIGELSGEKIVNVVWDSNSSLYVGGDNTIRKWDLKRKTTELVTLSSAKFACWDEGGKITAETPNGNRYTNNSKTGKWEQTELKKEIKFTSQNGRFRVYCGTTPNQFFENALYIRQLTKKSITKAAYPSSTKKSDKLLKVALVFDAYDNADGLPKIISTLNKYQISGTFFINGEFIRRYPEQTKQISLNGYECASMFFTTSDLTDKTFVIDAEFISRGLGRNEDEFLQCTGEELSLYWHAPYYNATSAIIQAGNDSGYEYINSPHLNSDNISLTQIEEGKTYVNPSKLIDEYVSLVKETKGGIIPVTVGISQGGRPQNVWDNLELLINALLEENFELVTVSELQ